MDEILFLHLTTQYAPRGGKYISIYPGIYVKRNEDMDITIRKYFLEILSYIFNPSFWYISDCSAILLTFNTKNEFYVRSDSSERVISLGKYKIFVNSLDRYYKLDTLNAKLGISKIVLEQALLQNLIEPKTNKSRVLPREEVINYIKKYSKGIRLDLIDEIAEYNKYSLAKSRFFEIYGKLKGTKDISREEESIILKTVKDGDDIDYERIKKFELLLNELVFFNVGTSVPLYFEDPLYTENFCFFESYFSNYIEGSKFVIEEAQEIIKKGEEYGNVTLDSHNVLDLYKYLLKFYQGYQRKQFANITSYENFRALICSIHAGFGGRTIDNAGFFKTRNNMNSSGYRFVDVLRLEGTLKYGFEMGQTLDTNTKRGLFYHYVLSECHPFNDGNGRLSRVVLNYFFLLDKQLPLIVTTKLRSGYLRTLTDLSRNDSSRYYYDFFYNLVQRMKGVNFFVPVLENDLIKDVVYDNDEGAQLFGILGDVY